MTAYADFKTTVLGLANRSAATAGAIDLVLMAMNDAVREAQRNYSFTLNKRIAFAQVSLAPVSMLTDFDADATGAGTLVVVKEIEACYEYATVTISGTPRYYRTAKVPFWKHSAFQREVNLSASTFGSNTVIVGSLQNNTQFVYKQGNNVFHSTSSVPSFLMFDVVEWLADHDGGAGTNVFLTYFVDWLRYATLVALNQYLKDSERFQYDETIMNQKWESVKQYDAQQDASSGMITLD